MTDLSAEFQALANYRPTHKVRFVTAASLFDGPCVGCSCLQLLPCSRFWG